MLCLWYLHHLLYKRIRGQDPLERLVDLGLDLGQQVFYHITPPNIFDLAPFTEHGPGNNLLDFDAYAAASGMMYFELVAAEQVC